MRKTIGLLLLPGLFSIACGLTSPSTSKDVDVVFRSPRDMNLQPTDVPDLEETAIEEPADEALLPEALDQDQRAYISVTQNVYVESSVIMVPERPTSEPRDVVEKTTSHRKRKPKLSNNGSNIKIGEKAVLIAVSNYCSSTYNDGYVLVFFRNNIIVVLFACGDDADEALIKLIGRKIDDKVTAPPSPEEIAGEETKQAVLNPSNDIEEPIGETEEPTIIESPSATPTEDVCSSLNLTPEECANNGHHEYSRSSKCEVIEGEGTCVVRSDPITNYFQFTGTDALNGWNNIGLNTYYRTETDDGPNFTTTAERTIVFNQSGYEDISIYTSIPKGQGLHKSVVKYITTFTIIK